MMSQIQQRSRTRRGAAYVERGNGEPLVLIHGVGMRLEAWHPQIEALSTEYHVLAVDLPGHGSSKPLEPGSGLKHFVGWISDFIDDLELDGVNVAGHSMGALIAGGIAAEQGARIARVALLNGVHKRDEAAREAVHLRSQQILTGHFDREAPLARWFCDGEREWPAYQLTKQLLSEVDQQGYSTAYAAFATGDDVYADSWSEIACPALFLTGDGDPNSTPAMAIAMAKAAQNGHVAIIEGHRHMVNLTAPDAVNAHLRDWLSWEDVDGND
jgi:pimeloyl-ACP methyl ester carboxylesterase